MKLAPRSAADSVGQQELLEAFASPAVAMAAMLPPVLTGFVIGWNFWTLGAPFRDGPASIAWIVSLAVIQAPLLLWTARSVRANSGMWVPSSPYLFQSATQLIWLGFLAWYSHFAVAIFSLVLLVMAAWNDIHYCHDRWPLRWEYGLAAPAIAASLLFVDLAGGAGLLARWHEAPTQVATAAWLAVAITFVIQVIIHVAGKRERTVHLLREQRIQKDLAQAMEQQERQTLQSSSRILAHGLTATKFSHDVASPVSVLQMLMGDLELALTQPEDKEVLEDLQQAIQQITTMTRDLALAVRNGDELRPQPIDALWKHAQAETAASLKGHNVAASPLVVELQPANVHVTSGHGSSIANIVVNAMLHSTLPVHVSGHPTSNGTYRLAIRDHGVAPQDRSAAIERIRNAFNLHQGSSSKEPRSAPERTYRGYGISLHLARVLILRNGGWVDVEEPADGPGVVFRLDLPLAPTSLIPSDTTEATT